MKKLIASAIILAGCAGSPPIHHPDGSTLVSTRQLDRAALIVRMESGLYFSSGEFAEPYTDSSNCVYRAEVYRKALNEAFSKIDIPGAIVDYHDTPGRNGPPGHREVSVMTSDGERVIDPADGIPYNPEGVWWLQ